MNNMIWLVRAARWIRNPPSSQRVVLFVGIIAAVILLGTIEWMGWWPEWATVDARGPRLPRP